MGRGIPITLKNLEAASQHPPVINNILNRVCMYYEVRAGATVISCIHEGQRRIRRFRQFLAASITGTGEVLLAKEMHFGVHRGIRC